MTSARPGSPEAADHRHRLRHLRARRQRRRPVRRAPRRRPRRARPRRARRRARGRAASTARGPRSTRASTITVAPPAQLALVPARLAALRPPVAIKQNSAPDPRRGASPTSCTSSRTSSSAAVSPIEAEKRGIRIIGTNHFMPENLLEFTAAARSSCRTGHRELAWTAARTRLRPRGGASRRRPARRPSSSRSTPASRGVHAISCGIDADNYTPDFTPRTEQPHPLRRPRHRREADRRAPATRSQAAARAPRRAARDRRRRRPVKNLQAARREPRHRRPRQLHRLRHRRGAAPGVHARDRLRDAVDRRAAAHRDDGGDGLRRCRSSPPTRWRCRTSCTTARTATCSVPATRRTSPTGWTSVLTLPAGRARRAEARVASASSRRTTSRPRSAPSRACIVASRWPTRSRTRPPAARSGVTGSSARIGAVAQLVRAADS